MSNTTAVKERKSDKAKEDTSKPVKKSLPAAQVRILKVLAKSKAGDGTFSGLPLKEIASKALVSTSFGWLDKSAFEDQAGKTKHPSLIELKMIKYQPSDEDDGPPVFVITDKGVRAIS